MENFYYVVFGLLALMCLGVELRKEKAEKTISSEGFKSFRNNYLLVYTLMMGKWHDPSTHGRDLCGSAAIAYAIEMLSSQLVIGSKAPTCMRCTPTTGIRLEILASFS